MIFKKYQKNASLYNMIIKIVKYLVPNTVSIVQDHSDHLLFGKMIPNSITYIAT